MIVNFLKDTLNKMEENGVSPDDVLYVFNSFGYCSWEEFEKLANFDYNNGYGLVAIDLNLIVRGSDWWLERGEYDGSEWWEYKQMPNIEKKPLVSVDRIICDCGHYLAYTLKSLNEDKE